MNEVAAHHSPKSVLDVLPSDNRSTKDDRVNNAVLTPISLIKNAFRRFQYFYHTHISLSNRRRISQVSHGISEGGAFLRSAYTVFDPVLSIFRNTAELGDSDRGIGSIICKRAKQTKIFSFIGVFISFKSIGEGVFSGSFFSESKMTIIVDKVLEILQNISDLFVSLETFFDGLHVFKLIKTTEGLSSAMRCFAIIGTIFGIAAIVQNIKKLFENSQLNRKLRELGDDSNQLDIEAVAIKIRKMDNEMVAMKFGVADGAILKARIEAIYSKSKEIDSAESKREFISTVKALRARLSSIDRNLKLKILASVVSTIASVILIGISGALLGHALLATAAAISIAAIVLEYRNEKTLHARLEVIAPDDCKHMQLFFHRRQMKEKIKKDPAYRGIELALLHHLPQGA